MKATGLFRNAQRTLNVPAGDVVFRQGDSGNEMFGVVEGEIHLEVTGRIVATLGPDDIFGEMALIDRSPRSTTAVATSDSVLAVIDRTLFLFLVQETPTFALSVMSEMANRFRTER